MIKYRTLDEQQTAWRKFLLESGGMEEVGEVPEPLPPQAIPEEIYHATRPPLLKGIMDNGLTDYSEMQRQGAGQMGISFTTDLEVVAGGNFGSLILVFSGTEMAMSGEYFFHETQHPDAPDESELRVTMVDSAAGSGAGMDTAVDELGTKVPFSYVSKLLFPQGLRKFEVKWFQENFPNLEIEQYDREKEVFVNINDSY
jgi:hypothetical protein